MSRQLEQERELKAKREQGEILRAVNGGLHSQVERAGGELKGFSVKLSKFDCLVTLRADFPSGGMVAFVGADNFGSALRKAAREAGRDQLRWKADKWA